MYTPMVWLPCTIKRLLILLIFEFQNYVPYARAVHLCMQASVAKSSNICDTLVKGILNLLRLRLARYIPFSMVL